MDQARKRNNPDLDVGYQSPFDEETQDMEPQKLAHKMKK